MDDRIKAAERIIKHGGKLIHDSFHASITKREKTRHDYVTEIDEKIERLVDREFGSFSRMTPFSARNTVS